MIKAIAERKSTRKFEEKVVPDEVLIEILESARLAPSGSNAQPWHFVVVRRPETKTELVEICYGQSWMQDAAALIVCVADVRSRVAPDVEVQVDEESPEKVVKLIIRDTTVAVTHLVLEAVNQGLGTCWVARFEQSRIRPALQIPDDKYVIGIIAVGYPAEDNPPKGRKALEEFVHYDNW